MTRLPGSASGPCFAVPHSPWPRPFAPRAPPQPRPLCSLASLLLWAGPTSPSRSSSATASGLPDAAPTTTGGDCDGDLPVSRWKASAHARVCDDAGPARISRSRHGPSRLLLDRKHQRPELVLRRSIPSLRTPLSTLRLQPHDRTPMTRGRSASLRLHRNGLAPSTFRRSPGAPVHTWHFSEVQRPWLFGRHRGRSGHPIQPKQVCVMHNSSRGSDKMSPWARIILPRIRNSSEGGD